MPPAKRPSYGCGGVKRSSPTGGLAKGIDRKEVASDVAHFMPLIVPADMVAVLKLEAWAVTNVEANVHERRSRKDMNDDRAKLLRFYLC